MPRRNTRKPRRRRGWYHVYNRARDGRQMFIDDADKSHFRSLLARHLSDTQHHDLRGRPFARLVGRVAIVTFAMMETHFHLIVFQIIPGGMEELMERVLRPYVRNFNARHGTSGPMFAGEYRADPKFDRRSQLTTLAYVHDNHGDDCRCEYCGHRYFIASGAEDRPSWLDVDRGLRLFGGVNAYRRFRRARRSLRNVTAESYA